MDKSGAVFPPQNKVIGNNFSDCVNIERWLNTIKAMPSWAATNDMHYGFVAAMKDKKFATIA